MTVAVATGCRASGDRLPADSGTVSATARAVAIDSGAGSRSECVPDSTTARALRASAGRMFEGASWQCTLDAGRTLRVVVHLDPDTSQGLVTLAALRLVREPAAAPFQTLEVNRLLAGVPTDFMSAVDIDGDGRRDLLVRFPLARGTNVGSVVWRYDAGTQRFVFDSTLSGLIDLEPASHGCVTSASLTGPGSSDMEYGTYCLQSGKWVQTRRGTHVVNESTGVAIEREYAWRNERWMLVRADTTKSR